MTNNKSYDDYRKADWLRHNTDESILNGDYVYRIFNIDHLLKDLKKETMTLVLPCESTQKDDLENPLRDTSFSFEGKEHKLFQTMMSTYYSQSWSKKQIDNWEYFGGGENTIRIKCKASLLFGRLMNIADKYYCHNYHMGNITYEEPVDIKSKLTSTRCSSFFA